MPITKSAKKALRQSIKRQKGNLFKKEAYRRVIKQIKKEVTSGKIKDAEKLLPLLYKTLDKAAKTNVIKKNKASRLKSRTSKLIQQGGQK